MIGSWCGCLHDSAHKRSQPQEKPAQRHLLLSNPTLQGLMRMFRCIYCGRDTLG